jgi:nicotinamidase/pyrazinamidase
VTKRLLIIDPQKDFIHRDGNYAGRHAGITQILDAKEKINSLLHTQNKEELLIITSDYRKDQFRQGLSICIPGTEGHAIDIEADQSYNFISKSEHSCFSSPAFVQHLRQHNVEQLIICGFLAEYCIQETAIDALKNGYAVLLIRDCIGTGDDVQNRKEQMLLTLKEKGAAIADLSHL